MVYSGLGRSKDDSGLEANGRLQNLQRNRLDLVRSTLFVVDSLAQRTSRRKTPTHQRMLT